MPQLKHPHPRERAYRQQPLNWKIKDTTSQDILEFVLRNRRGHNDAVVFDLDGTLFDVSHRTLGIVLEWTKQASASKYDEKTFLTVQQMHVNDIGYSLENAFDNVGLDIKSKTVKGLYSELQDYWIHKFFDGSTLLKYDEIYSGAYEFVQLIKSHDICPVYLTGRYSKRMTAGTIQQIQKANLPFQTPNVYLKQNSAQDDAAFKMQTLAVIASRFNILANFENEYVNIDGMIDICPDALHVIFDSQHSGRDVKTTCHNIFRLASWL